MRDDGEGASSGNVIVYRHRWQTLSSAFSGDADDSGGFPGYHPRMTAATVPP
jgi:hypothetical protein